MAETPLMKQYEAMKKKHPDAILLFRVGDFYETFAEDAIAASDILGITLTRRGNGSAKGVELAGFPHHALDTYLPKLVRAGRRVAICEQLEDPKLTKKLVKRGITELVTPGLNMSDEAMARKENNFLAAIHFGKERIGLALLDFSTGEFLCTAGEGSEIDRILAAVAPRELLRIRGSRERLAATLSYRCSSFELEDWIYTPDTAAERLRRHFGTASLKGFGIDSLPEGIIAAGSILHYLDLTHHTATGHITTLARIDRERFVALDSFTVRNLELVRPLTPEGRSLLDVLDHTLTPMGSRRLRQWLLFPLTDDKEISRRQDMVEAFFRDPERARVIADILKGTGDLERQITRLGARRLGPRDCVRLGQALDSSMRLAAMLRDSGQDPLRNISGSMPDLSLAAATIARTLSPDAPVNAGRGDTIARGVNPELDELRDLRANSRESLALMQTRESARTGISSLKIGFNNVFGYYIEVRNTHRGKVPDDWIRKQTLVSAERYITPELKEYEEKIFGAEEKISTLENRIYNDLTEGLMRYIRDMQMLSQGVELTDCLLALARAAETYGYVRPVVDRGGSISIREGRHPVIERCLPPGEPYIANSIDLDPDHNQIMIITGPNMSGKSALLRQTALITLMAQTGSFVPAESARIGIVDKIFTRVGASDNISSGESTFMTEMNEASAILNNMSDRSLILFDELGRGTSTYDGISIARAIVEFIHGNGRCRPKTLFATHYHELNEMERDFPRIVNYNVSVSEIGGKVVFTRKLVPGGSEHSFGIHVARLAGMPPEIVRRADAILSTLESRTPSSNPSNPSNPANTSNNSDSSNPSNNSDPSNPSDSSSLSDSSSPLQLSFFQLDDPLLSQIRDRLLNLDINNLTPLQALTALSDLQALLKGH